MMIRLYYPFLSGLLLLLCCYSCKDQKKARAEKPVLAALSTSEYIKANIRYLLQESSAKDSAATGLPPLPMKGAMDYFYDRNGYKPVWVDTGRWTQPAAEFLAYLDTAAYDGLYSEDYAFPFIQEIQKKINADSAGRMDGNLWTKMELLLTNAFMQVSMDLRQGRIIPDSLSWKHDTTQYRRFFMAGMDSLLQHKNLNGYFHSLRPAWPVYDSLRMGIPAFIQQMDTGHYTYLDYPYIKGDSTDSVRFVSALRLRLHEAGIAGMNEKKNPDSVRLSKAIRQYQQQAGITSDGKFGPELVKKLNLTDRMRRAMIAITLDKIKQLPDTSPASFIWVNLPAFQLQVWNSDTLITSSKIICGKPATPTPVITSAISDMVIYPTWTVPESIIRKEMLPGLKKNPGYLAKKGLGLYKYSGEPVDPSTINWSKYSKGIPYKIQQGSGDDNALGVIKFNFANPHFVYLHDTNQRYLFKNKQRALSHGCVRVQEWGKLAEWIIRHDSLKLKTGDSLRYTYDSVTNWIALKAKHYAPVRHKLPLFIRYMTCEGQNGRLVFYDDIYMEDKKLRDKYFAGR